MIKKVNLIDGIRVRVKILKVKIKYFSICLILLKWQIIGLLRGLFFTLKIDFTASSFVASAPRPNTVSVGNITSSPLLNKFFAISNLFFWCIA